MDQGQRVRRRRSSSKASAAGVPSGESSFSCSAQSPDSPSRFRAAHSSQWTSRVQEGSDRPPRLSTNVAALVRPGGRNSMGRCSIDQDGIRHQPGPGIKIRKVGRGPFRQGDCCPTTGVNTGDQPGTVAIGLELAYDRRAAGSARERQLRVRIADPLLGRGSPHALRRLSDRGSKRPVEAMNRHPYVVSLSVARRCDAAVDSGELLRH